MIEMLSLITTLRVRDINNKVLPPPPPFRVKLPYFQLKLYEIAFIFSRNCRDFYPSLKISFRRTCHHLFEIINKSQRGGKALLKDFDEVFFSAGQRDYQV